MADGVEESFKDPENASWFTLGNKESKFYEPTTPPNQVLRDYPDARIGFVLASPVLLLNEGDRTIDIHIECKPKDSIGTNWLDLDLDLDKFTVQPPKTVFCLTTNIIDEIKGNHLLILMI